MVDELQKLLPEYGGRASHARCFLHTTNLIAKSLLRVFEIKKGCQLQPDEVQMEIDELNAGWDEEEQATAAKTEGVDVQDPVDNNEGLVDLTRDMDAEERMAHEERICPVKLLLVKVRESCYSCISI